MAYSSGFKTIILVLGFEVSFRHNFHFAQFKLTLFGYCQPNEMDLK